MKVQKDYRASSSVRLFLVIENRMLREAMTGIFRQRPDFTIVGSVRFSEMAYSQAASSQWDILLADQASSCTFPQNFLGDLLCTTEGRKAILFGMDDDAEAFLKAIRSGVSGYLLGEASAEDTVAAARKVFSGEAVCPPTLCQYLFQFVARSTREGGMILNQRLCAERGLTHRQQQLVALLARGFTNKEIAGSMRLSEFTVKNHVHRIMRQLNAQSRYAAVQTVCENSLSA
ncbi:MAG TPA: response regulator transcription factor [Terriglobales bacterium]|nr:response regulator transcription factor [Terriglobales bacterium]